MDAAVDFAAALEAGDHPRMAWDKLRKASLAYRAGPMRRGRPTRDGRKMVSSFPIRRVDA